ncbi:MAG TPA: alkaline phosphatase family protein [Thermoanaerobaculia bacterium]|nr:alkaline phosphatase family protein [Thermoanaerobaculia bacterium]
MIRNRLLRLFLAVGGLLATAYVLVSLFLPSSRRLILGVDKKSGQVRLVRQTVTFLPPHRFYRLSFEKRDGAAQRDGLVRIMSKEGVPVTITYRLRFDITSERLADAGRLVTDGWSGWIRARVGEAVSAVTQQVPIEEMLSPSSQFNRRRDPLRQAVTQHLAASGLSVRAFEIARIEPDRNELLRYKRAEMRRAARGVAGRVAIFGIDGADWSLIQELSNDGRIPNIKALINGGASASLQTIQPTVSPLVWTTAATGVSPDRHGVIDFYVGRVPADAYARRAPALWEIAEGFGRPAMVVNWWTAWPPSTSGATVFDAPVHHMENAAYPAQAAERVRGTAVPVSTVGSEQVRRFLNITAAEYEQAVSSNDAANPVNMMRNVLAKTWSDHRAAINLYRAQSPLLFMMTYEGTDVVNHLAGPYHPPYREGIGQSDYRKLWPTVANYYAEIDRLIGEWMAVLPEDTTVMIVSAHGFRWGRDRPRTPPADRAALSDHNGTGIFVIYGNHVAPSRATRTMSIYDVVPTALAILGLPKSGEMPGQLVQWALKDISPVEAVRVVSYSEFFNERPVAVPIRTNPAEYQKNLAAIGHVTDPGRGAAPVLAEDAQQAATARPIAPQQWSSYAWYNNHGIELRRQGKTAEAIAAFQKAIDINPNRPTPYLNMSMTLFDRQQYTAADNVFEQAVGKGLPNPDKWFVDFAALYRANNMTSRAITLLIKGREMFPQSYLIAANLGSALAQADRLTEGLPELERALSLQPSSTLALNNLGTFYAKKDDYGRALDFWNRSLTIDPRQPLIRQAADAARSRL